VVDYPLSGYCAGRAGAGAEPFGRLAARCAEPETAPGGRLMALLEVKDLRVAFPQGKTGEVEALRGVDLTLEKGQRLGIVGESGAGKSMLAFAILNLIAEPGRVTEGSVTFDGVSLLNMSERQIRHLRGNR